MKATDPLLLRTVGEQRAFSRAERAGGRRVALVPTMGALHPGHVSLVRLARRHAERVVVSIFVNPTQFGPGEDFAAYPRDLERDLALLRPEGVAAVFAPSAAEVYPQGDATRVDVERLGEPLCGRSRPGHFRGVTTVVARLFHIVEPDVALFGEKDYQQLAVIRRMVRDLHFPIEIIGAPIVREPDGLAMSSRNAYLEPEQRRQALALPRALREAREQVRAGERDAARLAGLAREIIAAQPLAELDYVELCDADTLEAVARLERPAVLAVAARFGRARLIDNTRLELG